MSSPDPLLEDGKGTKVAYGGLGGPAADSVHGSVYSTRSVSTTSSWSSGFRGLFAKKVKRIPTFRLMDRGSSFHQSYGRWNIKRNKDVPGLADLYENDKFHTMVNLDTKVIVGGLVALYLFIIFCFACIYLAISTFQGCNMYIENIRDAYYFSLETMTTVGYGTADVFFDGCWTVLVVVSAQACCGLLIDAFLIGILFARLSRPQTRASTVIFSKNAIIRRVRGEFYFMFQVGELRKHQLLETHVRCYAMRHERFLRPEDGSQTPETVYFQTHYMRLQHPDDELGGSLLLVLPQTICHRIDAWSPMMPPPRWVSSSGEVVQWGLHTDKDIVKAPWDPRAAEALAAPQEDTIADLREAQPLPKWSNLGVMNQGARGRSSSHHTPGQKDADSEDSDDNGGDPNMRGKTRAPMLRRESTYWDNEYTTNSLEEGAKDKEKGPGYVYRFPDLLKRWDDVDGDRGTWYERMKRRVMAVELQRREEEAKKAEKANAKAAKTKRGVSRRASIMQLSNLTPGPDSKASPSLPGRNLLRKRMGKKSPPSSSGDLEDEDNSADLWFGQEEKRAIDKYLLDRELEVVVIVEGIDTSTGSTVQCRHSYAYDDLAWNQTFKRCVYRTQDGRCMVDFAKFHDTEEAPTDTVEHGFIQSFA